MVGGSRAGIFGGHVVISFSSADGDQVSGWISLAAVLVTRALRVDGLFWFRVNTGRANGVVIFIRLTNRVCMW